MYNTKRNHYRYANASECSLLELCIAMMGSTLELCLLYWITTTTLHVVSKQLKAVASSMIESEEGVKNGML